MHTIEHQIQLTTNKPQTIIVRYHMNTHMIMKHKAMILCSIRVELLGLRLKQEDLSIINLLITYVYLIIMILVCQVHKSLISVHMIKVMMIILFCRRIRLKNIKRFNLIYKYIRKIKIVEIQDQENQNL